MVATIRWANSSIHLWYIWILLDIRESIAIAWMLFSKNVMEKKTNYILMSNLYN